MKKIGIMTLYYKNNNYGGIAQAYALNEYFKKIGYDSEIITYNKTKRNDSLKNSNNGMKFVIIRIYNKVLNIIKKIFEKKYEKKIKIKLEKRAELLQKFRDKIEHSKTYNSDNIKECSNSYDFFVTGSDQCWKPGVIDENYVYNFLPDGKNVFSYASSIAVNEVNDTYKDFMKKSLKKYSSISVREEKGKEILEEITDKKINWVVDPTLLLEKEDWEKVTSKRIVNEKYIFSYILGNSVKQRKMIKKFAKEKGYKLVTIPHIKNGRKFEYNLEDKNFGDIQMLDMSFEDFFSLIKNAEYVVTDSFHAVVFSYIFERKFYVLERNSIQKMGSRIHSLLKILNFENRLIITKKIPITNDEMDYEIAKKNMREKIELSKRYIESALKK